jgi:hypothetical protein
MKSWHSLALVTLGTILTAAPEASASWPMCRHDAQRTGAAAGTSNITTPIAYWKSYLGGTVAPQQLAAATIQGQPAILLATTGSLTATLATGQVLWQSKVLGIGAISGIADLNGDGTLDITAYSNNHVYIFSAAGALEWAEPDGEIGTMGGVRLGDLNGDGKPEVVIQECGCCGVNSGNAGFIYSFAGGFGSPTLLSTLPFVQNSCGSRATTVINATGGTSVDVLVADYTHFALMGGTSASVLASTGSLGTWISQSECYPANLDGQPGEEAVCLENVSLSPGTNQRAIYVLGYNAQTSALSVVWTKTVAPDSGGDMAWLDPVEDLDGDGRFELVYSTKDPTNGWVTHVADALTGTDLVAPIAGQIAAGNAALEQKTTLDLLTSAATGTTAWSFARSPSPKVTNRWSIPALVMRYPQAGLVAVRFDSTNALATDLNGDGLVDLVANDLTPSNALAGFSGAGGSVTQVGLLSLPTGVDPHQTWLVPGATMPGTQVALSRTDGLLNLLDDKLNIATANGKPVDIHVGGYYASGAWRDVFHAPRVAPLDSTGHEAVVVDDSRETLIRLDASSASLSVPPTTIWQVPHTFGANVQSGLDGSGPGIACLQTVQPETTPPTYQACALSAAGSVKWVGALSGYPLNDPMLADLNKDGTPDFVFQLGDNSDANLVTTALSGANGSALWTTAPMFPGIGGTQSPGLSLSDWNGDGVSDAVFQGSATFVLSGVDGSQVATGGPPDIYALPILYDTNGDTLLEAIFTSGYNPVSVSSHDLKTNLWVSSDDDRPYPYAAIVQCPGTPSVPTLVEGSWQNPARLKMTPLGGSSLGQFTTAVLAGGQVYPNEASAQAAGAFLGQLTSANAHANLTGKGHPTAVVGSSDGWLYGLNPCGGTLDFAIELKAPVGEAVFGDTDGDGLDEILVTASDGYLYGIKNESIAPPAYVYDTDPDHGIVNQEAPFIVTTNKLSATWASVSSASAYEVQVVTPQGQLVSPPWKNVGTATSTSLTGLPLQDSHKYVFAVRAVGPNGPSPDALSPGIVVYFPDAGAEGGIDGGGDGSVDSGHTTHDASSDVASDGAGAPDGPGGGETSNGGGCGCETAGASTTGAGASCFLLLAAMLTARRRGSKSNRV